MPYYWLPNQRIWYIDGWIFNICVAIVIASILCVTLLAAQSQLQRYLDSMVDKK
jgi:hypothetical protein